MAVGQFMKRAAERDYSKFWAEEGSFPWLFQQALPPITGRPKAMASSTDMEQFS